MSWKNGLGIKLAGAAAMLMTALALYGFWYEPASLSAVEHPIVLDSTHRISSAPLKIAVIADLHAGAPYIGEAKVDEVVALANDAKPDLVLLTGDYVSKGVTGAIALPIETIAAKFQRLSAPLGVFAVLGNHDRWTDAGRTVRAFEEAGIRVLDDLNVTLKRGEETLYLAGISDFNSGPRDVRSALVNVPYFAKAICFTHSPDIIRRLPPTCALTIAGHTHGGQVLLPLFGRPIVPSRFGYSAGLIRENGRYLFVSTGIGTSILPVRFGVPPEVSILEIR